jgi:cation transporter-like permease
MFMSKVEGLTSISSLERRSASKYYIFIFFNVFLASIIAGSALEQLKSYLHQSANEYVLLIFVYPLCCTIDHCRSCMYWNIRDVITYSFLFFL